MFPPAGVFPARPLPPGGFDVQTECARVAPNQNRQKNHISDLASIPAVGDGYVTEAKFANVFLWDTRLAASWDQRLLQLASTATPAGPNLTATEIDNQVLALTRSCYFDSLTQYGIAPPRLVGRAVTAPGCVAAVLKDAVNGIIQWASLRSFAACEKETDPGHSRWDQLNIFVAPDLQVGRISVGPDPERVAICNGAITGWHAWGITVPNFAVMPINSGCAANLNALMGTTAHEMVEVVSDPAAMGWLAEGDNRLENGPGGVQAKYSTGELPDICQNPRTRPIVVPDAGTVVSFAGVGGLQTYWSNADNACVPQWLPNTVLARAVGSPAIRFTGQTHELTLPVLATADRDPAKQLLGLLLRVETGSDNLNGGDDPGSNVDFAVKTRTGEYVDLNVNSASGWGDHTLHSVLIPVRKGLRVTDIERFVIRTNFTNGDNWNVDRVTVLAATAPGTVFTGEQRDIRLLVGTTPQPKPLRLNGLSATTAIGQLQLLVSTGEEKVEAAQRPLFTVTLRDGRQASTRAQWIVNGHPDGTFKEGGRIFARQTIEMGLNLPPGTRVGDLATIQGTVASGTWPVTLNITATATQ